MSDFRDELVEAMALAWQEAQRKGKWKNYDECIAGMLDAALAFRQTVECPECGGIGWVNDETGGSLTVEFERGTMYQVETKPCPAGCIDGRVPGETRLAIVEVPWGGRPVFLLAPDLPEGTQE